MEYFQYLVDHVESLAKLGSYFIVSCVVCIGALRRVYFNHRYKSPKRIIKLIMYLTKYGKYLDDKDIAYTKMCINDEIMRSITKIPSTYNRKDLIYIFNSIEKKNYINILYKVQNYIERENGHFCIRMKFSDATWFLTRLMAFIMGVLFIAFMLLGAISIIENKNNLDYITFLFMAVVMELTGLWAFSIFPTRKAIEKINIELAKFRVPD
ncbi:hypothetical protein IV04_04150 [Serratia sp. Ag1]|nr:hypothetical protein JV45_04595 [Serratia sp. Ag2]KFK99776.1 hypothetical protein IV04_04150 [Serratia sp. Ag1]